MKNKNGFSKWMHKKERRNVMDEIIKDKTDIIEKADKIGEQISVVKGILELVGALAVTGKLKDKTDIIEKDLDTKSVGNLLLDASGRMSTIQELSNEVFQAWRDSQILKEEKPYENNAVVV